jgi:branched-chain amino acid transport system substrate-binding protein
MSITRFCSRPRRARALAAIGLVATTSVLAGCASGSTGSAAPVSNAGSASTQNYRTAAKYLGATKTGAASKSEPAITLGWVNEQGGTISSPEATSGAEAAVAMINDKLGGINGHPLKLDVCLVQSTEEQGQACAQQLYNNSSVIGVLTGATGLSSPALHSVLAGKKPVIGSIPSSPVDVSAKWSYYIGNGVFGAPSSLATYAIGSLHAKRIALLGPAFIGTTVAIHAVDALAKKDGVTVTTGTYPQGSSDVTPAVVASKASSADAVIVLDNTSTGCIAVAKAISQLNVTAKIVSLNTCAESDVKAALGDIPKWAFLEPLRVPVASVPDSSGQVADYLAAMAAYEPSSTVQASAGPAFATVMYAARLLEGLGGKPVTAKALNAAAASSDGPVFMGASSLAFGTPPFTAIGSLLNLVYQYHGNGSWTIGDGGKYQ